MKPMISAIEASGAHAARCTNDGVKAIDEKSCAVANRKHAAKPPGAAMAAVPAAQLSVEGSCAQMSHRTAQGAPVVFPEALDRRCGVQASEAPGGVAVPGNSSEGDAVESRAAVEECRAAVEKGARLDASSCADDVDDVCRVKGPCIRPAQGVRVVPPRSYERTCW